jgi:hypothetical protein
MEPCAQILEAVMLICFGVSWPIDIVHTLRVKHASKKSLLFLALIIVGYTAGLGAKFVRSSLGRQPLELVTWLYAVNILFLVIDLAVSYYYQTRVSGQAQAADEQTDACCFETDARMR